MTDSDAAMSPAPTSEMHSLQYDPSMLPSVTRPLLSPNAVQLAAAAAATAAAHTAAAAATSGMTMPNATVGGITHPLPAPLPFSSPPSLPVVSSPAASAPAPVAEVKVHPAVRMFEAWHRSHPHLGATFQPLDVLPISTLIGIIGEWILGVQKTHGGSYTADTLYVYLSSMQRHVRLTHRLPGFNLIDSEPVKDAMEKKFGPDAIASINAHGGGRSQSKSRSSGGGEEHVHGVSPAALKKRKRLESGSEDMSLPSSSAVPPPFLYHPSFHPTLFGLPSGDLIAFKPPKPSHCHRSFHTEQRLLNARQDPSTPEGLLRCLLWIMLKHAPSMSKTTCWNLTVNQFEVKTLTKEEQQRQIQQQALQPRTEEEQKSVEAASTDVAVSRRYLQYQPIRKRESTSYRLTDAPHPVIMYEQPSMLHLCPVYLFTELMKHRPPRLVTPKPAVATSAAAAAAAQPAPDALDLSTDSSHLWLLTKKTIDTVGDHAGQWYANRRIGQGTMEKLISVVKSSRNEAAPPGDDAIAQRAAKLLAEEENSDDEPEMDASDAHKMNDANPLQSYSDADVAAKRARLKREYGGAPAGAAYGHFAGLPANHPLSLYPWKFPAGAGAAASIGRKETAQQRQMSRIGDPTRNIAAAAEHAQSQAHLHSSLSLFTPPLLPAIGASDAAAAAAAAPPSLAPYLLDLTPAEWTLYLRHFSASLTQMKATVEQMEHQLAEITHFVHHSAAAASAADESEKTAAAAAAAAHQTTAQSNGGEAATRTGTNEAADTTPTTSLQQ